MEVTIAARTIWVVQRAPARGAATPMIGFARYYNNIGTIISRI